MSAKVFLGGLLLAATGRGLAPARQAPEGSRHRTFRLTYRAEVRDIPAGAQALDLWMPSPQTDPNQTIHQVTVDAPGPVRLGREPNAGNQVLHFRRALGSTDPKTQPPNDPPVVVTMTIDATRRENSGLAAQLKKPVGDPTPETLALLARYPFAGNVRELANELERAVILADPGAPITDDLLSDHVIQEAGVDGVAPSALQGRTDEFEREQIAAVLARVGGVKARAAEELGLTYRGLTKKMRRLGM